jgi:hypothetical protein
MFPWLHSLNKRVTPLLPPDPALPEYEIPSLPPQGADRDLVTIVKCTTPLEADRVVKKLKQARIVARIPDKLGIALSAGADLVNCYPHIRIKIAREDYSAARQLLTKAGGP